MISRDLAKNKVRAKIIVLWRKKSEQPLKALLSLDDHTISTIHCLIQPSNCSQFPKANLCCWSCSSLGQEVNCVLIILHKQGCKTHKSYIIMSNIFPIEFRSPIILQIIVFLASLCPKLPLQNIWSPISLSSHFHKKYWIKFLSHFRIMLSAVQSDFEDVISIESGPLQTNIRW